MPLVASFVVFALGSLAGPAANQDGFVRPPSPVDPLARQRGAEFTFIASPLLHVGSIDLAFRQGVRVHLEPQGRERPESWFRLELRLVR